jgi:hypothetical protein
MSSAAGNLLLVEGADDMHFLNQILRLHGYRRSSLAIGGHFVIEKEGFAEEEAVRIHPCGGFDNIPRAFKGLFQPDSLDCLAIVADRDLHTDDRWQVLVRLLQSHGFTGLPLALPATGLVHTQPRMPAVGVWLMPDNASEGMIETFAASLVPENDAAWIHAREAVTGLPDTVRRFSVNRHSDKAMLHTWLAWQEEPGCRTGVAVSGNLLRSDRPAALQFVAWVERWRAAGAARSRI